MSLPAPRQRTRIKVCGLTREQDVDAAVAAGADAVGFVLYPKSPRRVTPERAAELARRLPSFITPVLLFVNEEAPFIAAASAQVPGALLQFHGDETPAQCRAAAQAARCRYLRAARLPLAVGVPFDLVRFASDYGDAQALLLDAAAEGYGGGGATFDWSRLPASVDAHLVLSGGLTPANVADGILHVRPRCRTLAVDVSSGVEVSAPPGARASTLKGVKDAEKIHHFAAAVRAADEQLSKLHPHHARVPPA